MCWLLHCILGLHRHNWTRACLQELALAFVIAHAFKLRSLAQSIFALCISYLEESAPVHTIKCSAVIAQQNLLLGNAHVCSGLCIGHLCCCRELTQLRMASEAGTSSSAAPDVHQIPAVQHAGELAVAQRACDQAKADSANLQNTVQHLQSGFASIASVLPLFFCL